MNLTFEKTFLRLVYTCKSAAIVFLIALEIAAKIASVKVNFHSGKLPVDWNGQESFSSSCEFWVGTNDLTQRTIFLPVPIHG